MRANLITLLIVSALSFSLASSVSADLRVFEPFDFTGERLDGAGSGTGWNGDWVGGTNEGLEMAEDGQSLAYPDGVDLEATGGRVDSYRPMVDGELSGAASERLLESDFGLGAGNPTYYLSFLARKDEDGFFRIEAMRSDGISRWRVRVGEEGSVGVGMDIWSDSDEGVIESGSTYLVVSKFTPGNPAVAQVKTFETGVDTVPSSDAGIQWDATVNRATGVSQDRFFIAVSAGRVELDEFRFGTSWEAVVLGAEKPTFESWQATHFTPQERDNPAISGPDADPSGEGVPNLMKYAFFNVDPKEPIARRMLPQPEFVDGVLQLTYPERPDVDDVLYTVEVSTDLEEWSSDASRVAEVARVFDGEFAEQVTMMALQLGAFSVEPFDLAGDGLDGSGSGRGWDGEWFTTEGDGLALAADGESLAYPDGSLLVASGSRVMSEVLGEEEVASTRLLRSPISLAAGNPPIYISFLARRSEDGSFLVETRRPDGISRWGIDVLSNGIVGTRVGDWVDSDPGTFEANNTYLVVSKFIPGVADVQVKVFEVGVDTVPEDDADVEWDVAASGLTGVQQDRISLTIRSGTVELDELRMSSTWKGAVIEDESVDRNFMRIRLTQIQE